MSRKPLNKLECLQRSRSENGTPRTPGAPRSPRISRSPRPVTKSAKPQNIKSLMPPRPLLR